MTRSSEQQVKSQTRTYDRASSVVFLKTKEAFGGLSNMAGGYPLHVQGTLIRTSEALYQACRFPHLPEIQKLIIGQQSPMAAKMKSKPYRQQSRSDWGRVRVKVMRWCLHVKLAQNWAKFSELLLQTGDRPIVEESRRDSFWGAKPVDEQTLVGMNVLGRLLMELREIVKAEGQAAFQTVEPLDIPEFYLFGQPIGVVTGVERATSDAAPTPITKAPTHQAKADRVEQGSLFDLPSAQQPPPPASELAVTPSKRTSIADLRPYPAYKDSGVTWLGEVPEHWEVRRLKSVCRLAYGDALASDAREPGEVAVYGSNGRVGLHSRANTHAPCIILGRKGSFGKVNFSPKPVFAIDTTFFVDRRFSSANIRWLYYILGWLRLDEISKDSAVPGLAREDAYQRVLPLPPLVEQAAIARFLDYADRRIRRYVQAKKKLIALLNEQKQAIIHQAVTKGLNPNVPMKDSGVAWLGEVPAHWEILKVRHFAKVGNGSTPSRGRIDYWVDGHFPWLNSAVVNQPIVKDAKQFVTSQALKECHLPRLQPGTVLVAITGQGKTRGKSAVLKIEATINQHLAYIEMRRAKATPLYLQTVFMAAYNHLRSISDDSGSTKGALTCADIRHLKVPLPSLEEQSQILDWVSRRTEALERTRAAAETEINLLLEYRTRLIADVVTGKLDVREAAAKLPDEAGAPDELLEPDELESDADEDAALMEAEEEAA